MQWFCNEIFRSWKIFMRKILIDCDNLIQISETWLYQQECIPVGCVPPAAVAICWVSAQGGVCPGGCLPKGCLPRGCLPKGVSGTPPPLWTESQTPVKTLPCRNYIADGKNTMMLMVLTVGCDLRLDLDGLYVGDLDSLLVVDPRSGALQRARVRLELHLGVLRLRHLRVGRHEILDTWAKHNNPFMFSGRQRNCGR